MKDLLIIVDYQNDFVADNGKLTIGKSAQEIYSNIVSKINNYVQNDNDVMFTLDTHNINSWDNHPESKRFALHCWRGQMVGCYIRI